MSTCKLDEHSLNIILHSINNSNIFDRNTNTISILNNNNTLRKGGVGILEVDDNNHEEDLVEEVVFLYNEVCSNLKKNNRIVVSVKINVTYMSNYVLLKITHFFI